MTHKRYDESFFDYSDRISASSARRIVPVMKSLLPRTRSIADFGCARGLWLRIWRDAGAECVRGVDGSYVDLDGLHVPRSDFTSADLSRPLDLGRCFDLVQSLEVAEHLPRDAAGTFVATLTRHGRFVLFSAAPPGQGGADHVNERPYGYWRELFAERGYALFDCLRPRIAHDREVQPWYRFNAFLYVHADAVGELTDSVRAAEVPRNAPVPDISPLPYRLRKSVVRLMPRPVQNGLAAAVGSWRASRAGRAGA